MASIAPSPLLPALPLPLRSRLTARKRWAVRGFVAFIAVATVAVGLRTWSMGATLATSDQAAMAWMVRHSFGVKWIFAHDYGPVLPVVQRAWAEMLSLLGLPINEAAARSPIMLASLLQVIVTYRLLRQMKCARPEASLGSFVCAILPALVSDAHYPWGYGTLWLLTGTVALWATLAYLDQGRPGWLFLAGTALLLHCLGNCFAFALPVTLLYAWWRAARTPVQPSAKTLSTSSPRATLRLVPSFVIGYVLPCLLAITVIVLSWVWTEGGQLGRLVFKHEAGSTGLQLGQVAALPGMWAVQFGYLYSTLAAAGLIWATFSARYRPLAVWCWASLLPILLLVDWSRVGYLAEYLIEAAYAAGLLGALFTCRVSQRLSRFPRARLAFGGFAAIGLAHMAVGSADCCLNQGMLTRWTGVRSSWGAVRAETGIKAAGWYVRTHVPLEAVVLTAHTNTGMEAPVAEYYCGRSVLADCDLRPEMVEPLVHDMQADVDVLIVQASDRALADSLPGLELAATIRHQGQPVRHVYARRELHLPRVDDEASAMNRRFDQDCRCGSVPQALSAPAGFENALRRYQSVVNHLRNGRSL